jgi:hypothetical protein
MIPDSVRSLLHDFAAPAQLEGPAWERAIMERVMERGDWDDMRWLVTRFGRERLGEYLRERGHRVLPPRELRFWALVSRIPEATADDWVRAAQDRARAWRG